MTQKHLDRREFLKLSGLVPAGLAATRLLARANEKAFQVQSSEGPKNILVLVLDALSAYNVSLYGYPRKTMPNLANLAGRAVVYHNHFAGGTFTTPGTASLLTGTLPWTHRAFRFDGTLAESHVDRNLFSAFKDHYRIVYSHNPLVNTLFHQLNGHLDEYVPQDRLFLLNDSLIEGTFGRDKDIASVSWARTIKRHEDGYSYSLFLSRLYENLRELKVRGFKQAYPRGLPNVTGDKYFLLEDAVDFLRERLINIPRPFVGYFHFLPPHFPYKTHRQFYHVFEGDGYKPVDKPWDLFHEDKTPEFLFEERTTYDEFILYADREVDRFVNQLDAAGLLDNTWLVITSDHGEFFERGVMGHSTAMMFQPITRIPLVIFEPGRKERLDIHIPTSAADILPTLMHVTGQAAPEWSEGVVLPPFAPAEPAPERNVYSVYARFNDQFAPFVQASLMMVKWPYKLSYYFGFKQQDGEERVDLFDIQADPEEMNNLYPARESIGDALMEELRGKLAEKDEPYR